jgi:hypothetical protein
MVDQSSTATEVRMPLMPNQSATPIEIRKAHIEHETSLRGMALLYYFAALFIGIGGLLFCFERGTAGESRLSSLILGFVLIAIATLYAVFGRAIRRLEPWSRTPATVLACLGLLGFPLGTAINGYILYLLHSNKGKTLFTPEYREIMLQTPEVHAKTSLALWLALVLVILIFIIVILVAAWGIDWNAHVMQDYGAIAEPC